MRSGSFKGWAPALVVTLLVLLSVLAVLQVRWIDALSASESARLTNFVQTGVDRLAADFEAELVDLEESHRGEPAGEDPAWLTGLAERHARWRARATTPDLVSSLLWVEPADVETPWSLREGTWHRAAWTPELALWRTALLELLRDPDAPGQTVSIPTQPTGLAVPMLAGATDEALVPGVLVILLDPAALRARLAQLVQTHLGQPFGPPVDVFVSRDQEPVFFSRDGLASADFRSADLTATLGGAHQVELEAKGDAERQLTLTRGSEGVSVVEVANVRGPEGSGLRSPRFHRVLVTTPWEIRVRHRAGSIAAAMASVRRKNLAMSLGVLAVLGAAALLLLVAAQRTRRLAAQRMQFVAGITHELRTPLTVIQSAAENLVDGVVSQPEQARRYGRIIHDEGRRLSDLVEQALALAGAESRSPSRSAQRLDLVAFLPAMLSRWRQAQPVPTPDVGLELPPRSAPVLVDAASLERALGNLLGNAVKYGGWPIGVRVECAQNERVDVTVWDRGPGIPPDEQARLFEPFFRGARARESQSPGSGLGLSVVKSAVDEIGGTVSVRSAPGAGASFTLHLPAARP